MQLLTMIDAIAGVTLTICAVLGWAAMSRTTKHCYRVVYGIIGVAGAAIALAPLADWLWSIGIHIINTEKVFMFGVTIDIEQWSRTALIVGFAFYMALERRGVQRQRAPEKQDPDATYRGPMSGLMAMALAAVMLLPAPSAHGKNIAVTQGGGIVFTLTDEPCALEAVKNLAARATWLQDGKLHEGCYGVTGGMVLAYFDDRTVLMAPLSDFNPVNPA